MSLTTGGTGGGFSREEMRAAAKTYDSKTHGYSNETAAGRLLNSMHNYGRVRITKSISDAIKKHVEPADISPDKAQDVEPESAPPVPAPTRSGQITPPAVTTVNMADTVRRTTAVAQPAIVARPAAKTAEDEKTKSPALLMALASGAFLLL